MYSQQIPSLVVRTHTCFHMRMKVQSLVRELRSHKTLFQPPKTDCTAFHTEVLNNLKKKPRNCMIRVEYMLGSLPSILYSN